MSLPLARGDNLVKLLSQCVTWLAFNPSHLRSQRGTDLCSSQRVSQQLLQVEKVQQTFEQCIVKCASCMTNKILAQYC